MDGFVLQRWPSRAMGVNAKHLGHRMRVHDGHDDDDDGNGWMANAQREKGYLGKAVVASWPMSSWFVLSSSLPKGSDMTNLAKPRA